EIYAEKEEELKDQIAQEEDRATELEEMDLYTKSIEYIKDMANRLGLIFGNEIIFKEDSE
ncbi:MAG: septum formation initiator family protein, partial [Agathobacter sp.]|nr:septum formation initiator family protein [Agathobacter sp.]